MNARDDLLRAHVAIAMDATPLQPNAPEVRDLVDAYVKWPALLAKLGLEELRAEEQQRRDGLLHETPGVISRMSHAARVAIGFDTDVSEEPGVLRTLRQVGAKELCGDCGEPDCRRDPDCRFRVRVAHGMHEGRARGLRAAEWRQAISEREAARRAA